MIVPATPLDEATQGGFSFSWDGMDSLSYSKPPLSLDEQIALLRSRGMVIAGIQSAKELLFRTNYYRFCGYALHFEIFRGGVRADRFQEGTKFEDVSNLMNFDDELRRLLLRFLGPLEIAFRTAFCYEMSIGSGDPFWYTKRDYFFDSNEHRAFLDGCRESFSRSDETFVRAFKAKYSNRLPPCWMMIELASFGGWSKLYGNLKLKRLRQRVAGRFGVREHTFRSWIRSLAVLRNACAHHKRIWNQQLSYSPTIRHTLFEHAANERRVAARILVLSELLKPLKLADSISLEMQHLMDAYPIVDRRELGFLA